MLKITPPAPDPAPEYPRPKPLGSPKAGGRKKASSTSPPSATEPSGDKMVATRNGTIAEKYSANSADLMASDWEEYKSGR